MPAGAATVKPSGAGRGIAFLSLLVVLAGIVGYFVAVTHLPGLPSVRNYALPNWLVVAVGIGLAIAAVRRAPRSWLAKALLGIDVVLASLFAAMLYVFSVQPAASGPAIGGPAPDFALRDERGDMVRLVDLRGAPVLLVFYRGHW